MTYLCTKAYSLLRSAPWFIVLVEATHRCFPNDSRLAAGGPLCPGFLPCSSSLTNHWEPLCVLQTCPWKRFVPSRLRCTWPQTKTSSARNPSCPPGQPWPGLLSCMYVPFLVLVGFLLFACLFWLNLFSFVNLKTVAFFLSFYTPTLFCPAPANELQTSVTPPRNSEKASLLKPGNCSFVGLLRILLIENPVLTFFRAISLIDKERDGGILHN